jgi:hypothetical protein
MFGARHTPPRPFDQFEEHATVPLRTLHDAIQLFHDDPLVFLPLDELLRRLRRLAKLL